MTTPFTQSHQGGNTMRKIFLILIVLLLAAVVVSAQDAAETEVQMIELSGPAASRDSELSSLDPIVTAGQIFYDI